MKQMPLVVPMAVVDVTLRYLRRAGERRSEGVVLWLGRRVAGAISVIEAYVPDQETDFDFFRIPPHAMAALLTHIGATESFIAAQVHSHPHEAFHSEADDRWAIVRHLDAFSLVVPHFARDTTLANFVAQITAFRLSAANEWRRLDSGDCKRLVTIA